jgi:hypothetical protein
MLCELSRREELWMLEESNMMQRDDAQRKQWKELCDGTAARRSRSGTLGTQSTLET